MSLITHSRPAPAAPDAAAPDDAAPKRIHRVLAATLTAAAALVVFLALVVPNGIAKHKAGVFLPGAFLRIPLEGLIGAAILIALPTRARRVAAVLLWALIEPVLSAGGHQG